MKPEKESEMNNMRLDEFPDSARLLIQKLSKHKQNRILYPHKDAAQGRKIQETIIQVLEESIKEGESEESILDRLSEYASTIWS